MIYPVSIDIPLGRCVHFSSAGEVEFETIKGEMIEGSFSSKIMLKVIPSKGAFLRKGLDAKTSIFNSSVNRLYISGNPTKFLQGHNIWGTNDIKSLLYRFIEQICIKLKFDRDLTDRMLHITVSGRFDITRIDLTESFLLNSSSDVRAWIRASAQLAHGKCQSVNSYNERTLYMGKNSRRMTIKIYAKGDEIKVHKLPVELDKHKEFITLITDRLLRVEVTLRTMALKDMGLHVGSTWDEKRVSDVFASKVAKLNIPENALIDADVLDSMPSHLQGYVALWQAGHNLKSRMSKPTYYRVRKELLAFGIDIKMPPAGQVTHVIPLIRVITAQPFIIPTEAYNRDLVYVPESPFGRLKIA